MAGKGSLLLVIGFGVIMMYIIANLVSLGTRATEHMAWYNNATASKNLATVGANVGLAQLREYPNVPANWDLVSPQTITSGAYSGGSFRIDYIPQMGGDLLLMRVVSNFPVSVFQTLRDTVEVYLLPIGANDYRMFGWISDKPGNAQFFFKDDIIWGPIHTNGGIHTHPGGGGPPPGPTNVPIFHGMVTARQTINPVGSDFAKFLGGYQVGGGSVDIPGEFDELISVSAGNNTYFTEDLFINIDGDMVNVWISDTEVDPSTTPDSSYSISGGGFDHGAIYSEGNIRIQGVLDGQVSIGAGQNIIIVDDIRYATNPPFTTENLGMVDGVMREQHIGNGDDLLGLYSANDIIIADKGTAKDFTVHGVLLALGELVAQNHNSRTLAYLDTWGSIIMHERGKVRHANSGLIQRYRYDTRLEDESFRPRYFPGTYTSHFEIISWYESIQLPPM